MDKTPRAKTSLRHDLGFSSQEHSGVEQFETREEKDASAEILEVHDGVDEGVKPPEMPLEMKNLLAAKRRAKNFELIGLRAKERSKEQSELLETVFECTTDKANAIDQRLKALGPGCRLHEAPALVANELSGIPIHTYKGLASGQLVATMPPNAVRHVGTDTAGLAPKARSMGTSTEDLPANQVAAPALVTQAVVADPTDVPANNIMAKRSTVISYILSTFLLMLLGISLYKQFKDNGNVSEVADVIQKQVFSQRYSPTASLTLSTPVKLVYPPTPAPQLGLGVMMKGGLLGGGWREGKW